MRVANQLKQSKANKNISDSGLVSSSQKGVHPKLEKCIKRHLEKPWAQPFHFPSVEVYRLLVEEAVFSNTLPIILDSGCGTGKSTQRLAQLYPRHLVIGVDRSHARLTRSGVVANFFRDGNYILLRAELATFWRLMLEDGHSPEKHFLFYPNPWPKPGHLSRRWHGHPVFPQLLALGGEIELRCNWEIYAQEFALAVNIVTAANTTVRQIQPESGITPFEQKYLERGQSLFAVSVTAQETKRFKPPG